MKKLRSNRATNFLETTASVLFFLALAYIGSLSFARFDLTSEKRHTLTPTTVDLVENLDDVVYVKVYLAGEFPADYRRLQRAIKDKLDEMRAYAGDNIQYEFINPGEAPDRKSRDEMYAELVEKGLSYTVLQMRDGDGVTERILFPGALVSYNNREVPLQILRNQERATDAEMVNRAINNLEYSLVNAIYQAGKSERDKIAFIEGHGELSAIETGDIRRELSKFYDVERIEIGGMLDALSRNIAGEGKRVNKYSAIVVAKPDTAFSERDKYLIDQFIMLGGRVLWMIDPMQVSLDSLMTSDVTMALPLNTNLEDMLFNYGVRLNRNLLLDRTCAPIALMTGPRGNERQELFPWYFEPVLIPTSSHPIVANVDPIHTEFISSIDTVEAPGISKRILLTTSPYTRILRSPARVSFNIVSIDPNFGESNSPNQPVAVLLEGEFTSNFANRLAPAMLEESRFDFREKSVFTRQIVIADGDIARNPVNPDRTKFRELGFDPIVGRKIYGNKELLVNAMNYLLGDESLIDVRSRTVVVRKLDEQRISEGRYSWQVANVALPVVLTLLLGLAQWWIRRKRYRK